MTKINLKEFILLIDGAQDEDTEIVVMIDGEETLVSTLIKCEDAIMQSQNLYSSAIVESFTFSGKTLLIEVSNGEG